MRIEPGFQSNCSELVAYITQATSQEEVLDSLRLLLEQTNASLHARFYDHDRSIIIPASELEKYVILPQGGEFRVSFDITERLRESQQEMKEQLSTLVKKLKAKSIRSFDRDHVELAIAPRSRGGSYRIQHSWQGAVGLIMTSMDDVVEDFPFYHRLYRWYPDLGLDSMKPDYFKMWLEYHFKEKRDFKGHEDWFMNQIKNAVPFSDDPGLQPEDQRILKW